jgi:hypothetical protein
VRQATVPTVLQAYGCRLIQASPLSGSWVERQGSPHTIVSARHSPPARSGTTAGPWASGTMPASPLARVPRATLAPVPALKISEALSRAQKAGMERASKEPEEVVVKAGSVSLEGRVLGSARAVTFAITTVGRSRWVVMDSSALPTRAYGYRSLRGGLRETLRLSDSGLWYRGRQVDWRDVAGMRTYPDFRGDKPWGWLNPRLRLYLIDGDSMYIRGAGLTRTVVPNRGREIGTGLPVAYVDLVAELRRRDIPDWRGPREETILLQVMLAIGLLGACLGATIAAIKGKSFTEAFAFACIGWVVLGNATFIVSPFVAREQRRRFLAHAAVSRPAGHGGQHSAPSA